MLLQFTNQSSWMKRFWQVSVVAILLALAFVLSPLNQIAHAAELKALPPQLHTAKPFSQIKNADQALLYLNAQNLVDTWNNIIIQAKTGDEQLQLMRESGVFADDVRFNFQFDNQNIEFNRLDSPKAHEFYTAFVNGLKKNRYNIASNVEAVEFGKDALRFNFKHWIFFNNQLSVVGENQALMQQNGERYQIQSVEVRMIYFDVAHGY